MDTKTIFDLFCKLCLIIFILMCMNSLVGDAFFRIKYSFPEVSHKTDKIINTYNEPIQIDIKDKKYMKARGEKDVYALEPQAEYSLSGLVVAKNSNFWFRDIMRSKFDDLCLIDFGIVWGELSNPNIVYNYLTFKSKKTLGQSRTLYVNGKNNFNESNWSVDYVNTHLSHTHMIPANTNIMAALLTIKKNDIVKIDGYLVDIYSGKGETIAKTSLSRCDTNPTSRGYGACEVMLVKQVQIDDRVYK